MKFKVVFSIDAADELLSIIGKVDAVSVLSASETIRKALESDHAKYGNELKVFGISTESPCERSLLSVWSWGLLKLPISNGFEQG